MLNEKMWDVFSSIEETAIKILPSEYQLRIFGGKIKLRDIITQIMLEYCEYAYNQNAEKSSLRAHRKQRQFDEDYASGDAMKGQLQRAASDMNQKNIVLGAYVKRNYDIEIKSPAYEQDETVKRNRKPYAINDKEAAELLQLGEIKLLKVILDRKFLSLKFYNDEFKECSNEYDAAFRSRLAARSESSEKMVINTLSIFTIEWQYYFDFIYEIVDVMEKNHIREIPDVKGRFTAFCYQPTITTALLCYNWPLQPTITVTSRAILLRRKFIEDIAVKPDGMEYQLSQTDFLEALYLISMLQLSVMYEGVGLCEWFCNNTDLDDWASVCGEYDVSAVFMDEKRWTNKKIRYAKKIYKEMLFDYLAYEIK